MEVGSFRVVSLRPGITRWTERKQKEKKMHPITKFRALETMKFSAYFAESILTQTLKCWKKYDSNF